MVQQTLQLRHSLKKSRKVVAASRRRGGKIWVIGLVLLSLMAGGGYAWYRFGGTYGQSVDTGPLLTTVTRGPFDHIVLEEGEVESSSNIEVVCQVKSRGGGGGGGGGMSGGGGGGGTPILWVIDEGTYVKKGDKLVELDTASLELEAQQQRKMTSTAEAAVTSSKAAVETAEISLSEYQQGTYLTERRLILSEIAIAEQELRKAGLNLASAERLAAKGMVKALQIEAENFAVLNTKTVLESAKAKLKVLDELTRKKMEVQFISAIETAKAKLASDEAVESEEKAKLKDIQDLIAKCMILSPADGVVVYANQYSSRGGSAEFVVEAGATVRERQTILKLPDPSRMQVKAKINESRITLVSEGMPAKVAITAANGEMLGRVKRVNKYAEPGSWFSSTVKEYATFVEIIEPPETIRTGMTAEVRIFVEQLPDALQVPVQAIYEFRGRYFCLKKAGDKWETVEAKIGGTNDKTVTIIEGLTDGDSVVLDPRNYLDLMKLPDIPEDTDRSKMAEMAKDVKKAAGNGAAAVAGAAPGGGDNSKGKGSAGGYDVEAAVDRTFAEVDKDNDGKLSSAEIDTIEESRRDRTKSADANGDGVVERKELVQSVKKRAASFKGKGKGGPGGGGPGGGGPGGFRPQ